MPKKKSDCLSLWEMLFNNNHTAIAILDRDFNFIRVNELYAKADNRPVTDFPGHNHFEFYPNDEVKKIFENVVQTKETYQIFARPFIYPDNPERGVTYWDWTLESVTGDTGEVEVLIFTLVDVTGQKRKEIELERFFELSYDLLSVVDYNLFIKRVNKSFENILGYSKNHIEGTNAADYIHPEDKTRMLDELNNIILLNKPVINIPARIICKDGSYRWVEWTNIPNSTEKVCYSVGRDVTEKKRIEEELLASCEKVSNIIESITDGFFILDQQWRYTYFNNQAKKLFKVDTGELIGKVIWDVFPVNSTMFNEFTKAVKEKVSVHFELYFESSKNWYEIHGSPSREGLLVSFRIINERKQMEANIMLNKQRLEALVKMYNMTEVAVEEIGHFAMEEMISLTGSGLGYLGFVNEDEAAVTIFAWSKNAISKCQIIAKSLVFKINEGGLWGEALRQRKPVMINDYSADHNGKRGLPDGHVPLQRLLNVPIFDGDRMVMQAVVADKEEEYKESDIEQVTLLVKGFWTLIQRKKAEENLRDSEDRYRNLFENSMDGVLLTKTDGTIISANTSICRMLGMSEQEIIQAGRSGIVDLTDARLYQLMAKRELTGECKGELNCLHKNGSIVPVELTSRVFSNTDGDNYTSVFVRDISGRIKTQREMARLDRLNLIAQMAAGIGHEVRNPMTTVRGFLQMLREKDECARYKEYYDLMIDELDRANSIITKYLSLAKNSETELQKQNLNNIINELYPLLQADALNSNNYIIVELEPLPDIDINKEEIHQLILNLVRNGLEAMQKPGSLTIKTFIEEKEIVLSVKDGGTGIDPAVLDRLGTPFLTTKAEGTGLGLATCYSIAERNNASIEVESTSSGATFFVRFSMKI